MADLATAADVAAGWRVLTTDEQAVATTLIHRASALVRVTVPGLDATMATSSDYTDLVVGVVSSMVQRAMTTSPGVTSTTKSVDDWSETVRYADAAAAGLYLSPEELLLLTPSAAGAVGNRAASIYTA